MFLPLEESNKHNSDGLEWNAPRSTRGDKLAKLARAKREWTGLRLCGLVFIHYKIHPMFQCSKQVRMANSVLSKLPWTQPLGQSQSDSYRSRVVHWNRFRCGSTMHGRRLNGAR